MKKIFPCKNKMSKITGFKWMKKVIDDDNNWISEKTEYYFNLGLILSNNKCNCDFDEDDNNILQMPNPVSFLFAFSSHSFLRVCFIPKHILLLPVSMIMDINCFITNPLGACTSVVLSPYCLTIAYSDLCISIFSGFLSGFCIFPSIVFYLKPNFYFSAIKFGIHLYNKLFQ